MDFGVICVEVSQNFSKNPHFRQKSISTQDENFESVSTEVPSSPPTKISLIRLLPRITNIFKVGKSGPNVYQMFRKWSQMSKKCLETRLNVKFTLLDWK